MHDAVCEGWRANNAGLGFVDGERAQRTGLPGAVNEPGLQVEQPGLGVLVEYEVSVRLALAGGGSVECGLQRLVRDDLVEEVLVLCSHVSPLRWPRLSLALLAPMPDPAMCFPKEVNAADHQGVSARGPSTHGAVSRLVVTHAAPADVVVRVRRSVVPVRRTRTGVRAIVPVPAQDHGVTRIHLSWIAFLLGGDPRT